MERKFADLLLQLIRALMLKVNFVENWLGVLIFKIFNKGDNNTNH